MAESNFNMNVTTRKQVPVTLNQLGFRVKSDNNGSPMVYKWEPTARSDGALSSMVGAVYLEGFAAMPSGEEIITVDTLRIPILNTGNGTFVGGIRYQDRQSKWRDHVRINRDFAKLILQIWSAQTMAADAQDKPEGTAAEVTEVTESSGDDPFDKTIPAAIVN